MAFYKYRALFPNDTVSCGVVSAQNRRAAALYLRQQNLDLLSLRRHVYDRIGLQDMAFFFLYLSYALQAGYSLAQALEVVQESFSGFFRLMIRQLSHNISQGLLLSQSCAQYEPWFTSTAVALIQAGEASGQLFNACKTLNAYFLKNYHSRDALLKAMAYPVLAFGLFFIMSGVLICHLVPAILPLLTEQGKEIPRTLNLLNFFYQHPVVALSLTILPTLVVVGGPWRKKLGFLFFGRWISCLYYGTFFTTLGVLVKEKVPLIKSIHLAKFNVKQKMLRQAIDAMEMAILQGESFGKALDHLPYWSTFYKDLLKIGQKTGNQSQSLMVLIEVLDADRQRFIQKITLLVPPILLCCVGVFMWILIEGTFFPLYHTMGGLAYDVSL